MLLLWHTFMSGEQRRRAAAKDPSAVCAAAHTNTLTHSHALHTHITRACRRCRQRRRRGSNCVIAGPVGARVCYVYVLCATLPHTTTTATTTTRGRVPVNTHALRIVCVRTWGAGPAMMLRYAPTPPPLAARRTRAPAAHKQLCARTRTQRLCCCAPLYIYIYAVRMCACSVVVCAVCVC